MLPKVLIVDDDAGEVEVLERAMRSAGLEVLTHPSSVGVLGIVERERPDAILIALELPTISGDVLARMVVRRTNADYMPVILLRGDLPQAELNAIAAKVGAAGAIGLTTASRLAQIVFDHAAPRPSLSGSYVREPPAPDSRPAQS